MTAAVGLMDAADLGRILSQVTADARVVSAEYFEAVSMAELL
jgi:hypothetical protein